jgi:3-oxoacyl-[acyl-carrier-protein] synthase II
MESRAHAEKRGAQAFARLSAVASDRSSRAPGAVTASLQRLLAKVAPQLDASRTAVISGATGVAPATAEEQAFLAAQRGLAVRATGTHIGHGIEPPLPCNRARCLRRVAKRHSSSR